MSRCRRCLEDVQSFRLQGPDAGRYLLGCPGRAVHERQDAEADAEDHAGVDLMADSYDMDERTAEYGTAW